MAKAKLLASTPFSDFIRNASPAEKQRVYAAVMKKVAEHQNRLLVQYESILRARSANAKN